MSLAGGWMSCTEVGSVFSVVCWSSVQEEKDGAGTHSLSVFDFLFSLLPQCISSPSLVNVSLMILVPVVMVRCGVAPLREVHIGENTRKYIYCFLILRNYCLRQ